MKILLVEDDDVFVKALTRTLKAQHYIIDTVKDGEMGWTYGSTFEYDLIILDIVLPKLDGISLCKRLRSEGYTTPILLLSAQNTNTAKVQGLDAGADDYVVKPFDRAELVARIRSLLRRSSPNPLPLLTCGDLLLNPSTCEVTYQGQHLALTRKEYELLELMMRDSQHVFSTEELLEHLWSSEDFPSEATVRSHIRRLRHKLLAIGAPPNFLATLHGQGYYLKVSGTDATPAIAAISHPPLSQPTSPNKKSPFPEENRIAETQQQYLDFLNETWATTKPNSLDQVAILFQAVSSLQADRLTPEQQVQAQHLAHKLAGTLSIFGLNKAVHLSRQLEYWLGDPDALHPNQAPLMQSLVLALQQEISETPFIQLSQLPNGHSPMLLLISTDPEFNQSLAKVAVSRGIQFEVLPMLGVNATLSEIEAIATASRRPPDTILLRLPLARSRSSDLSAPSVHLLLQLLQECSQRYPGLPIVVIGDHSDFHDRLEVARRGGKLFLDHSNSPEQVIAAVVDGLKTSNLPTKVMIVDDDEHWLRTLPTLLKPWGFKVTTLADSQQFWTVLQAIAPDVVVLDAKMPHVNGFEVCQMLRSDLQWHRLPILFLSELSDSAVQQQAFAVGADDYLCKPIMGSELANRILNRLQRVRAWSR